MKVLLSAYACRPNYGTEPGNGWGWATNLAARGLIVHVFTAAENESWIGEVVTQEPIRNLNFHYVKHPTRFFTGDATRYASWQWALVKAARRVHRSEHFDLAHHVTYGSIHVPSQLWRLGIPVVFGPVGGGQTAPASMLGYFGSAKRSEQLRTAFTRIVGRSPLHRSWLGKMGAVLTSNRETLELATRLGRSDATLMFDAALPNNYLAASPRTFTESTAPLRVLWVGRMLPRKAIGLTLDIFARVGVPATLTIVGEGIATAILWRMIDERGLRDRVSWAGSRLPFAEVRAAYLDHDAFLFTSLRDSCAAQLLEAMAMGLPVITLNIHGAVDLVPVDAGIKVDVDSPAQVIQDAAAALDHFAGLSGEERSRMSQIGWSFARTLTYSNRAKDVEKLYRELLASDPLLPTN